MTYESFLTADDIRILEGLDAANLDPSRKDEIIKEIKAAAWRESQLSGMDYLKPKDSFDIRAVNASKPVPDGWEASKARVKAQLDNSRMNAPIEGTRNEAAYASNQREEAEAKRVAEWKQRKEIEIGITIDNRINREVENYNSAKSLTAKKAALESLSPEALQRIVNKGTSLRTNLDSEDGFKDEVK